MKNILMLITQLSMGGAEKVFYDHLLAFSHRYSIKVCLFTKNGLNPNYKFQNEITELDYVAISNPLKRWQHRSKRLKKIIEENNIDTIISHMEGPNFLNCLTKMKGVKKICVVHGSLITDNTKSSFQKFITNKFAVPYIYNKADYVVGVSKALVEELVCMGVAKNKAVSINNYFNLASIKELGKVHNSFKEIMEAHICLLHVGRLASQKNQKPILKVFQALLKKVPSVKLFFVGDGNLKDDLISYSRSLDLKTWELNANKHIDDNYEVYFVGADSNPYPYMVNAGAFIMTSYFEGFPLVLGEALACGLPVISVDCNTGPREILSTDGSYQPKLLTKPDVLPCGILMPDLQKSKMTDAETSMWADEIIALLGNERKYKSMKEKCISKAQQYDIKHILPQWYDLIDN